MNIGNKLNLFFLLFVLSYIVACHKSSDDGSTPDAEENFTGDSVKVMTYNTYSGHKKGIEAIADVISKLNPDVVGLQEIETNSTDFNFDVPKRLAELTAMPYYYFVKAIDLSPGQYGNVILSKYPITEQQTILLDRVASDSSYLRSFGLVKVNKSGRIFYFGVTHLDQLSPDDNRLHQLEVIHSHTDNLSYPVILSGDFNAQPTTDPLTYIKQYFTLGCMDGYCGYSSPAPKPTGTIDYILSAPADSVRSVSYDVDYDSFSQSDHFPVYATFIVR